MGAFALPNVFALPKSGLEVYAENQTMVGCTAEAWLEANAPIQSHPMLLAPSIMELCPSVMHVSICHALTSQCLAGARLSKQV